MQNSMLGLFAEETVAGPQLLSANGAAKAGAPIAMRRKKERRVVMDEIIVGPVRPRDALEGWCDKLTMGFPL